MHRWAIRRTGPERRATRRGALPASRLRHLRPRGYANTEYLSLTVSASADRLPAVRSYRLKEVAQLLGVSDDTVRRWAERDRFATSQDGSGHRVVEGAELARFAQELA